MAPLLVLRLGAVAVMAVSIYCIIQGSIKLSDKSYAKSRENMVSLYRDAIVNWNTNGRAAFAKLNACNLTIHTDDESVMSVVLSPTESLDYMAERAPSDVPRYTPLRYSYTGDLLWPNKTEAKAAAGVLEISCDGLEIDQYFTISKVTSLGGVVAKVCRFSYHGIHVDQNSTRPMQCLIYSELSDMCISIGRNSSGSYEPVTEADGTPTPCRGGSFANMQVVPPESFRSGLLPAVDLTIRSNYDPYIIASRLTNGSFNFGLTGKQYVTTAVVTLVFGILGSIISVFLAWCVCRRKRAEEKLVFTDMQSVQLGNRNVELDTYQKPSPPLDQ